MFKSKSHGEKKVVMDLDKLVETERYFKLHGKARKIKPISTKEYLELTNTIQKLSSTDNVMENKEELQEIYYGLFHTITDDITMSDIESMSLSQISALMIFVMDVVSGRDVDTEGYFPQKKKLNQTQARVIETIHSTQSH